MRYVARVIRPRFEVAIVEVDLPGSAAHREAASQILDRARHADVAWTMSPFDPEAYAAHIEMLMSDADFLASEPDGDPATSASVMSEIAEATRRYALLGAELHFGLGLVIPQPWFEEEPEILPQLFRTWKMALSASSGVAAVSRRSRKKRRGWKH